MTSAEFTTLETAARHAVDTAIRLNEEAGVLVEASAQVRASARAARSRSRNSVAISRMMRLIRSAARPR